MNNKTRFYIVTALAFVAFTVIAFLPPFEKSTVFWLSYLFGVVAVAVQVYAIPKAFDGKGAKSKFYGFPIARVAVLYLIAQLLLSLVFMATGAKVPAWIPVLIYVLLLCAAVAGLVSVEGVREEVQRQDAQNKKDTSAMRALQAKVNAIANGYSGEGKAELNKLAEAFRFSDPVSSEATQAAEAKLSVRLDDLSEAVEAGKADEVVKLCIKVGALLSERNAICKGSK